MLRLNIELLKVMFMKFHRSYHFFLILDYLFFKLVRFLWQSNDAILLIIPFFMYKSSIMSYTITLLLNMGFTRKFSLMFPLLSDRPTEAFSCILRWVESQKYLYSKLRESIIICYIRLLFFYFLFHNTVVCMNFC